jgi:hypothetical protein
VALGQVYSEYFGFPVNSHSTDCSTIIIIYHLGLVNRSNSGHNTKWIQSHPVTKIKRKKSVRYYGRRWGIKKWSKGERNDCRTRG